MSDESTKQLAASVDLLTAKLDMLTQIFAQSGLSGFGYSNSANTDVLDHAIAFRWEKTDGLLQAAHLVALPQPQLIDFDSLDNIDLQKAKIKQNTEQFVKGYFANNVLLTGARGTGKSSLIRACLKQYHHVGLRVIEVEKKHLNDLPRIVSTISQRPEKFIIFCDDLSFEEGDTSYAGLKTVLDGSLAGPSNNVLIYATSNRKHLMVEKNRDNLEYHQSAEGEIHPGESIEEKVSLADRFGLHLTFYGFNQAQYLSLVQSWLRQFGWTDADIEQTDTLALQWATQKGNRSGRAAMQFAKHIAGQRMLAQD